MSNEMDMCHGHENPQETHAAQHIRAINCTSQTNSSGGTRTVNSRTFQLRSFSNSDQYYAIDKAQRQCSCPSFLNSKHCKHLEAVGIYPARQVTLTARPSFSQALSGLVKGIRLRDAWEGAYWLHYCWQMRDRLQGAQFRIVRRLLIGAAEDGHSVSVMERVSDNYIPLLSESASFEKVLAELIRICAVPNWWHPESGGHDYIYSGMVATRRNLYAENRHDIGSCCDQLRLAVKSQDRISAIQWVLAACDMNEKAQSLIVDTLLDLALYLNHGGALRLVRNVYLRHARSLKSDSNFVCQAAWLMAGGVSAVLDAQPILDENEVSDLAGQLEVSPLHVIPAWCCDGVHCAGADIRYAGMWDRMYAVCNQYKHYQRLDPNDPWLEDEFYPMDGLLHYRN